VTTPFRVLERFIEIVGELLKEALRQAGRQASSDNSFSCVYYLLTSTSLCERSSLLLCRRAPLSHTKTNHFHHLQ
jgi:hypothetical protein